MTRLTEYGIYAVGVLIDALAVISLAAISLALIVGTLYAIGAVLLP